MIVGPPQGPSGLPGSRSLHFLRKGSDGVYRSSVDIYRPDIGTPWIGKVVDEGLCENPPLCISRLLLTYRDSDDAASFAASLSVNVADSRQLSGFMSTFELLEGLVEGAAPIVVKRAACSELSGWYVLEIPLGCRSILPDFFTSMEYLARVGRYQKELHDGGFAWMRRRAEISSESDVLRYRQYLLKSADEETRRLAKQLM